MYYPQDMPYLKLTNRAIALPKGEPLGRNNIVFLMSNSRQESLDMTKNEVNFKKFTYYRYFFYNFYYRGKINGRPYNIDYRPKRKQIRKEIEGNDILMYPMMNPGMGNDNHGLFFDLSEYLNIFFSLTPKMIAGKKIVLFWNFLKSIINNEGLNKYPQRLILVNVENFKTITGPLKVTMMNPVFVLYYTLFKDYTILKDFDIDFVFYTGRYSLKINPAHADKSTYREFMVELKKLYRHMSIDITNELDDEVIMKNEREEVVTEEIKKSFNFTGPESSNTGLVTKLPDKKELLKEDPIDEKIKEKVQTADKKVESIAAPKTKSENHLVTKAVQTDAENMIDEDDEIIRRLYEASRKKVVPKSQASSARDEMLRKKQEEIKVGNMTVGELKNIDVSKLEIPTTNVSNVLHTTNENVKSVRYANFNKTYIENVMPKDITNAILSLNDKSMPIYVRDINVEDTSNELNYIDTYTIELEDANRQRSTIKVDIPKFLDDKFMWLGGNKKLILNQNFLLPVVKTSPDNVWVVTNYNKMSIIRDGVKSLGTIEKLTKMLKSDNGDFSKFFTVGNASETNSRYITTIEYDELSKLFTKYQYKDCTIFFDQSRAQEYAEQKRIKIPDGKLFIGVTKEGPIFIDYDTQLDDWNQTIVDIIFDNAPEGYETKFKGIKSSKRLMYAKVKTMEKFISVGVLLSFWEGFGTMLKKMDAKYRLTDTYPKDLRTSESVIRFKDVYFVYEDNALSSLLINGMRQMKTEEYEFAAMDGKEPYMDVLKKIYGKVSIANALDNTYEFTIDPITMEILKDLNLPTDIVSLMIYAVRLLADNQYTMEINQGLSRIRTAEIIPSILYDTLAKNYINYKNSNGRKKFSIPRDAVIKKLLDLKTVEDYSTLNPILELERTHTVSTKGWRGVNLDDSYTVEKRAYDQSMVGIIGVATSPDGSVGVARTLTMEPMIKSVRGYVDITDKKDYDKLKDVNLFSPGELSIPLGATRDDPTRIGHAIKQSKHVIPVKKSSPVLISTGIEESCRFSLSSDFVINAADDGKVIEFDEKNKIMVVEYKNGKHQAVNLAPNIVKNGGGGFYESNILITNLKVGDKFKINDVLAWNKDFFQNDPINGCRMNMGTLTKIAFMSTYNTYEDATFITEKLSKDAASEMCFQRAVVVGKNAAVSHIAKVGDEIEVGDSLIQFDTSFEDESLNDFLSALSKDPRLEKEIMDSSKNNIKSKIAGVIEDIKIYSTVELDEMSPSLKRIVKSYYNGINEKKKLLDKYDPTKSIVKCGMLLADTTGKVEPNKFGVIRGQKVEDSVLIEFYIKHTELLEVGSKIANFTALKNTICEIIPEGFEPYSDFHKEEEIGSIIASNSILKRMTPSILLTGLGNKNIVELRRALVKMWQGVQASDVSLRRKGMEKLIYDFFDAFDKSGTNTNKYRSIFEPMSDVEFKKFFDRFVSDPDAYLILDIVDYEHTIKLEDIERAAKVLNIPLFETVYLPHITMDKKNIIMTQEPVPVGYVHIKRTQQTVMKKNGVSTSIDARSAMTGQVTASDKNGRETDLENSMLISVGLDYTLRELNGPRADDLVMKNEMLHDIATKGYVSYNDLTNDLENKTTLNTVNTYMIGMGLDTDLVTTGLMLPKTLRSELK